MTNHLMLSISHWICCRLQFNGSFPRIIIAGDMNVRDIDWNNNTVKEDPQYGVSVNQKFFNIVDDHIIVSLNLCHFPQGRNQYLI